MRPYQLFANDTQTVNDVYCTAIGSVTNAGVSSNAPQISVAYLVETYDLDGDDQVFIDTGSYDLTTNIYVSSDDAGGSNRYVSFIGSTSGTVIARTAPGAGV